MAILPNITNRRTPNRANNYAMNNQKGQLGRPVYRDTSKMPAPIVSASVGSAGMKRTSLLMSKMHALGCSYRLQSALVYDCNSTNINQWINATRQAGVYGISVTPDYVPFADGFQRDPWEFLKHYSYIQRDLEKMLNEMERRMAEAGSRPQIVVEWIGFGGHALISYMLHDMIVDRFPATKILPIFSLPAERQLEENIRRHGIWDTAQRTLGDTPCLITDNRSGYNFGLLDERVAMAIASIEACAQFKPETGTLGEVVNIFAQNGSKWLSLDCCEIPHPVNTRSWRRRSERDRRLSLQEVGHQILTAINSISEPKHDETRTAVFRPPDRQSEFRISVVLPFDAETVAYIQDDVEDLLKREEYERVFPGGKVSFAPGNSMFRGRQDISHIHISKLTGYPVEEVPVSLARIIDNEPGHLVNDNRKFPSWADMRLDREERAELTEEPGRDVSAESLAEVMRMSS